MSTMGVRAYARHRGLSATAVSKAIKDQRLVTAISRDKLGRPLIDSDKADIEWPASNHEHDFKARAQFKKFQHEESNDQARGEPPPPIPGDEFEVTEGDDPGDNFAERKGDQTAMDFARARADKEQYSAKVARTKYEKELGILVDAEEVKKKWASVANIVKTKILALPSKIRARVPGLTSADYAAIEKLTRDTLSELSNDEP